MNNTEKIFKNRLIENYLSKFTKEDVPNFEALSYKKFIEELKKQKVKLSASQQMDLFNLYDCTLNDIEDMNKHIDTVLYDLDLTVFSVYKIPDETIKRIMN